MQQDFKSLLHQISQKIGFDFTQYRMSHLERRFGVRLSALQIGSYHEYAQFLEIHPEEYQKLCDTLFIHVSHFFRDEKAWECLWKNVLPEIICEKEARRLKKIRVWCAGTSTGEEVYTVAMLLHETLGEKIYDFLPQIYGTDVDKEPLARAAEGRYVEHDLRELPQTLLYKYFRESEGVYTISDSVRLMTKLMPHNLVMQAPLVQIDLLICRNVLIYFSKELQFEILQKFYHALQPNGYLMLGKSESLPTEIKGEFEPVNHRERIYRKNPDFFKEIGS